MEEEDYEVIRNEVDAEPERFRGVDLASNPRGGFRRTYSSLNPDQRAALSRQVTENHDDDDAASSAASSSAVEYAEIRGGHARPSVRPSIMSRRESISDALERTRTETERINKAERHPTALDRIDTHRTQHSYTVKASTTLTSTATKPLPNFGAGKPYPPPLPDREEYVVEFDGHDDPTHPQNWAFSQKIIISAILAFQSLCATFASSIFSNANRSYSAEFGVSTEVGNLGTALFVLGYAFGPIVWAPMSELYGRKLPLVIGCFGMSLFMIAVAVGKDIQTVMICRFFSGAFGSCPLVCVAAVYADIWNNELRGIAVGVFSSTVFLGPLVGPFIGGFINESYLGWRWTSYLPAIMGFGALALLVFFLPESYPPAVLVAKASELRRRTKNWGIHARQEEIEVDIKELVSKNLTRPFRILFTEPIVFAVTLYMSFVYTILYIFLTAYAIVFQQIHGFNQGVGGLPYFGLLIGVLIGFAVIAFQNKSYVKKLKANQGVPIPEWRIPIACVGGVVFTLGLFWFGWTGYTKDIHWIVPTLSGIFTGFGIYTNSLYSRYKLARADWTVFLQLLNYLIDAYLMFAASAIAGNTVLRSGMAASSPMFAGYMFNGIGVEWAGTLLGCLALIMIPVPVAFLFFGAKIREKSKLAPGLDLKLAAKLRQQQQQDEEAGLASPSSEGGAEKKGETGTTNGNTDGGSKETNVNPELALEEAQEEMKQEHKP